MRGASPGREGGSSRPLPSPPNAGREGGRAGPSPLRRMLGERGVELASPLSDECWARGGSSWPLPSPTNGETEELNSKSPKLESEAGAENDISIPEDSCQGIASSSCCQNGAVNGKSENLCANSEERESRAMLPCKRNNENKPSCSVRKASALPSWFECWELEDSYAALAVVTAIASVAVAYSCYRQL